MIGKKKAKSDSYYLASQWKLMWRKLRKHVLARISVIILGILYFCMLFSDFLAPYGTEEFDSLYKDVDATKIYTTYDGEKIGPFVFKMKKSVDMKTRVVTVTEDTSEYYKIEWFVHGVEYKLLGFIPCDLHLYGLSQGSKGGTGAKLFIFGGDNYGRDIFSRVLLGSKISLSMPLASAFISLFLGILIGSISGYFGGWVDIAIQRVLEIISAIPRIPLWIALSAAIPPGTSSVKMYIYMTIILSFINWTGMARTVRGKFLSSKNEDYVLAAKMAGASTWRIIWTHMVPGFMSYLIVSVTRSIPSSIIGETSMSYLGLGIKPPATSWGVLLQECRTLNNIVLHPNKMIPILFVTVAVLAFNFFGDGLRDAADPYK